jgi:hypothetical protein
MEKWYPTKENLPCFADCSYNASVDESTAPAETQPLRLESDYDKIQ